MDFEEVMLPLYQFRMELMRKLNPNIPNVENDLRIEDFDEELDNTHDSTKPEIDMIKTNESMLNSTRHSNYKDIKSSRSFDREPPNIDFSTLREMKSEDIEPPPNIDFDDYKCSAEETVTARSSDVYPPKIDFSTVQGMKSEDSEPPPVISFPSYSSEESAPFIPFENYLKSRKSPIQSPKKSNKPINIPTYNNNNNNNEKPLPIHSPSQNKPRKYTWEDMLNPNKAEFESETLYRIRTNRLRDLIYRERKASQPVLEKTKKQIEETNNRKKKEYDDKAKLSPHKTEKSKSPDIRTKKQKKIQIPTLSGKTMKLFRGYKKKKKDGEEDEDEDENNNDDEENKENEENEEDNKDDNDKKDMKISKEDNINPLPPIIHSGLKGSRIKMSKVKIKEPNRDNTK